MRLTLVAVDHAPRLADWPVPSQATMIRFMVSGGIIVEGTARDGGTLSGSERRMCSVLDLYCEQTRRKGSDLTQYGRTGAERTIESVGLKLQRGNT